MNYFKQKISNEIFKMKYMINGEETPEEVFEGIAENISSIEKDKEYWKKKYYEILSKKLFIPGGRILANARPNTKMPYYNNCYVIDIEDSIEGIYDSLKEDALISRTGGGVGLNFSKLRPKGAEIKRGGFSSGSISFMEVFDASAKVIHTGGGRRCLPYFYEVKTIDGYKRITELTTEDKVLFKNNEYKIKNIYNNGKQKVLKIRTNKGYHLSTETHKWLVQHIETKEVKWVETKDLNSDYYLLKETVDNDYYELIQIVDVIDENRYEETYDIEVEEIHLFTARNPESNLESISHNSAHIAVLNIDHPDIEDFITVKRGDINKKFTQFNISVGITDEFMKAVKEDKEWELKWGGKVYKKVKARELFEKIMKNAYIHNEPGVLFLDTVNKYDNGWYSGEKIQSTNPCVVEDTKVKVKINNEYKEMTIKDIVMEYRQNKNIEVLSYNEETDTIEYQPIVFADKTRENAEIVELEIEENGKTYTLTCTPDHKIYTKNRGYVEAKDLTEEDEIVILGEWKEK